MSNSLMAIKLLDGTLIYARDHRVETGRVIVKNLKYKKDSEITKYVDDEMTISDDAIDVWFKTLKGGKEPKEITGTFKPTEPTPAA